MNQYNPQLAHPYAGLPQRCNAHLHCPADPIGCGSEIRKGQQTRCVTLYSRSEYSFKMHRNCFENKLMKDPILSLDVIPRDRVEAHRAKMVDKGKYAALIGYQAEIDAVHDVPVAAAAAAAPSALAAAPPSKILAPTLAKAKATRAKRHRAAEPRPSSAAIGGGGAASSMHALLSSNQGSLQPSQLGAVAAAAAGFTGAAGPSGAESPLSSLLPGPRRSPRAPSQPRSDDSMVDEEDANQADAPGLAPVARSFAAAASSTAAAAASSSTTPKARRPALTSHSIAADRSIALPAPQLSEMDEGDDEDAGYDAPPRTTPEPVIAPIASLRVNPRRQAHLPTIAANAARRPPTALAASSAAAAPSSSDMDLSDEPVEGVQRQTLSFALSSASSSSSAAAAVLPVVHFGVSCNGCFSARGWARYRCSDCPVNLCDPCYIAGAAIVGTKHTQRHEMVKMREAMDGARTSPVTRSGRDDGNADLLPSASNSSTTPRSLAKTTANAQLSKADQKAATRAAKEERLRAEKSAAKAAREEQKLLNKQNATAIKRLSRSEDHDEEMSVEDENAEKTAAAARRDSDDDDDEADRHSPKSKHQNEPSAKEPSMSAGQSASTLHASAPTAVPTTSTKPIRVSVGGPPSPAAASGSAARVTPPSPKEVRRQMARKSKADALPAPRPSAATPMPSTPKLSAAAAKSAAPVPSAPTVAAASSALVPKHRPNAASAASKAAPTVAVAPGASAAAVLAAVPASPVRAISAASSSPPPSLPLAALTHVKTQQRDEGMESLKNVASSAGTVGLPLKATAAHLSETNPQQPQLLKLRTSLAGASNADIRAQHEEARSEDMRELAAYIIGDPKPMLSAFAEPSLIPPTTIVPLYPGDPYVQPTRVYANINTPASVALQLANVAASFGKRQQEAGSEDDEDAVSDMDDRTLEIAPSQPTARKRARVAGAAAQITNANVPGATPAAAAAAVSPKAPAANQPSKASPTAVSGLTAAASAKSAVPARPASPLAAATPRSSSNDLPPLSPASVATAFAADGAIDLTADDSLEEPGLRLPHSAAATATAAAAATSPTAVPEAHTAAIDDDDNELMAALDASMAQSIPLTSASRSPSPSDAVCAPHSFIPSESAPAVTVAESGAVPVPSSSASNSFPASMSDGMSSVFAVRDALMEFFQCKHDPTIANAWSVEVQASVLRLASSHHVSQMQADVLRVDSKPLSTGSIAAAAAALAALSHDQHPLLNVRSDRNQAQAQRLQTSPMQGGNGVNGATSVQSHKRKTTAEAGAQDDGEGEQTATRRRKSAARPPRSHAAATSARPPASASASSPKPNPKKKARVSSPDGLQLR